MLVRVRQRYGHWLVFLPGHDKTAESAVISVEYGGVPEFWTVTAMDPAARMPGKKFLSGEPKEDE